MNNQLYIYDCLVGKLRVSDGNFMTIGAGRSSTFRVVMDMDEAGSFAQRDETCRFFPHGRVELYSVNGEHLKTDFLIRPGVMYLFVLGGGCFLAWYGDAATRPDFSVLDPHRWYVYNPVEGQWTGPIRLQDLPELADNLPDGALATFEGLGDRAFYVADVLCAANHRRLYPQEPEDILADEAAAGEYRCPGCWRTFAPENALAIASSPDLVGDDVLGFDAMKRFVPEHFDERGLPLDEHGSSCTDWACPCCHMKLPPFFHLTKQHIISIVGVPAAGKSYYMASLVGRLEVELPREFGMPFRDADPAGNAPLNDMRMRLFSATTPQEAYIGKTKLQGSLYRRVWVGTHFVHMPRPFIYNINKGSLSYSVVLYDNAGENYEPGRDAAQNTAAGHITVSSGILFLFDPTVNPGFRSVLKDNPDPQLRHCLHMPGRQATMLAEAEMRLRKRLNLGPDAKLDVPLAVLVGKCDTWSSLLGPEPLLPLVHNGMFVPEHVNINSARIRQLVFNVAPNICTNAEAISNNVRYFAVSALGESPVEFRDADTGATLIGPASGQVQPFHVTDPLLWVLSCAEPSLFPCAQS
ncbi:MAG: hypothetical protein ACI4OZ_00425 [Akkermansia sp.]